jgi:hypothetical protein
MFDRFNYQRYLAISTKSADCRFAPSTRVSEGYRIRAGEEADEGDIAPTKTGIRRGTRAKTNMEKFDRLEIKIWEILEHLGEPRQSFHRHNSDERTRKLPEEEWRARHGRVWPKIQMKLNGRTLQTNSYIHSVTNLAVETARYSIANSKMKISNCIQNQRL